MTRAIAYRTTVTALELFQPRPDARYSLDATARLAGVSRRTILIYCRAGLLHPVFQPPYGVMEFTTTTGASSATTPRLTALRRYRWSA